MQVKKVGLLGGGVIGGAWAALRLGFGLQGVFAAIGAALLAYGAAIAASIAGGAWFTRPALPALPASPSSRPAA